MPLLPFLKNKQKQQTGVIVHERQSDTPDASSDESGIEAAAQDILNAISQNDSKHLALALKAAFDILESQPHAEAEHLDSEG